MPTCKNLLFMMLLCPAALCGGAQHVVQPWQGMATYTVWLPSASDPVVYEVRLNQQPTTRQADPLAPCDYMIQWSAMTPSGPVEGFSAYFDGHHYRYRDQRLQEYHYEWDSIPFVPRSIGARTTAGVQQNVQFADLLPAFVAQRVAQMQADTTYTITRAREGDALKAVQTLHGVDCQEVEYQFDANGMPIKAVTESNPGSIAEQTIEVEWTTTGAQAQPITEQALIEAYPEVFEKYRENNFRIENLAGTQLPTFSCPTVDGQRVTHHRGEGFATPTLVALVDPAVGTSPQVVQAVQTALARLPYQPTIYWALTTTNGTVATELVPNAQPGETVLLNARGLARDCGAADLPALIFCRPDGTVADVVLGYRADLADTVLQKMAMLQ